MAHPFVELARKTIESYVRDGKIIDPPKLLEKGMEIKAGVFVSLHKRELLRGCIGTFLPTRANVAEEIISNAISASTRDPRFPAVRTDELKGLDISVDVLSAPERAGSVEELDAKKLGVIVRSGNRTGLLLPDLEGVDSPMQQISICRQKGGIGEREPIELFKFTVNRYH